MSKESRIYSLCIEMYCKLNSNKNIVHRQHVIFSEKQFTFEWHKKLLLFFVFRIHFSYQIKEKKVWFIISYYNTTTITRNGVNHREMQT